jgi:hypothetical protein
MKLRDSVWNSVADYISILSKADVGYSVQDAVGYSVWYSVWNSVHNSVAAPVDLSVYLSVERSVERLIINITKAYDT